MSKAYLNALFEEGTKQDCFDFLCKADAENDRLRTALAGLLECHPSPGEPGSPVAIARAALQPLT